MAAAEIDPQNAPDQLDQLRFLHDVARLATTARTWDELLETVVDGTRDALHADVQRIVAEQRATVAVAQHPVLDPRAVTADQDRRGGGRLRPLPDRVEVHVPAVVFRQSYGMYFFGARYQPLTVYMYPPPPPMPPPFVPPPEPAPA